MKLHVLIGIGAATLVAACSSISVTTDFDPSVSFADFTTYYWITSGGESANSITSNRIRVSVDSAMATRGFRKVDSGGDLAIAYQVTTNQRSSFTTVNTGWGGGWGWHGGWGGMGMSTTTQQTWNEGTLVLALFETTNQDMVWTASATADLDQNKTPDQRQQQIDDAVEKMMAKFPPGS
jgi:hypothetical protein